MITRKSVADHFDAYDSEIADLQAGKRDTLEEYRFHLAQSGFTKAQIKAEVEALKAAMRRRRAVVKSGKEQVEQADALADEIFVEITARAPRATRTREIIEEFDPETGEFSSQGEGLSNPHHRANQEPAASLGDTIAASKSSSVQPQAVCSEYAGTSSDENPALIPQSAETLPADKPEAEPQAPTASGAPSGDFDPSKLWLNSGRAVA